jgi:hypothetical protein
MVDATGALEKALVDACLESRAGDALVNDLRGFLEARGVASDDIAAIEQSPRRILVYRALVRNGLLSVVSRLMPRTRARMNAACGGRFDSDYARFLQERGPRTHYLRDVPREFFDWARPHWDGDVGVPPYLVDLGAHELDAFELASFDASPEPRPVVEIDLERPAVFSATMRLVRYRWAVHELPDEPEVATASVEPEQRPVALVGYRDEAHAVLWLDLTPLAAGIVERLAAGDAFDVAIRRSCADQGAQADPADIASLLSDLGARGVLLGGVPVTTPG